MEQSTFIPSCEHGADELRRVFSILALVAETVREGNGNLMQGRITVISIYSRIVISIGQ